MAAPDERLVERRQIAEAGALDAALRRMADEIAAAPLGFERAALVGIHTGGVPLARRLRDHLARRHGVELPVGTVDIALYRDDVLTGLPHPIVGPTQVPIEVTGSRLILVDDVLFTGRTVRAALDALVDLGRPRRVELAVLVDRGHRELPIRPDYVGFEVHTHPSETVRVELTELGAPEDRIVVYAVQPQAVAGETP